MNIRKKRNNLEKVLTSIPVAKVMNRKQYTLENCVQNQKQEDHNLSTKLQQANIDLQYSKQMTTLRRKYRYNKNEQNVLIALNNKYRSLQINNKHQKRKNSGTKIHLYNSIDDHHKEIPQTNQLSNKLKEYNRGVGKRGSNKFYRRQSQNGRNQQFSSKKLFLFSKTKQYSQQKNIRTIKQLKEKGSKYMEQKNYQKAYTIFQKIHQGKETDIQLLHSMAICQMNLKQYQQAIIKFYRILILDKLYDKKVYVYLSLCQNYLNHHEQSLKYLNQCIQLFPNYYDGYFAKGKLFYKKGIYHEALNLFLYSEKLSSSKDITMAIADCYEKQGMHNQAIEYYSRTIDQVNMVNLSRVVRYANLLIKQKKQKEAISLLQKCICFIDKQKLNFTLNSRNISATYYLLVLAYYRQGLYKLSYQKGEQILSNTISEPMAQIIKIMIICKLKQYQYYQMIYLYEKVQYLQINISKLKEYVLFIEAIMLLIKKKNIEAIQKLQSLRSFFDKQENLNEFNTEIYNIYCVFLYYAYFVQGRYQDTLNQIEKNQRNNEPPQHHFIDSKYIKSICNGCIYYNQKQYKKALQEFTKAKNICPNFKETQVYQSVTLYHLYFQAEDAIDKVSIKQQIFHGLNLAIQNHSTISNNYTAFIYYFRGLFYAWEEEWSLAALDVDQAIERAQQNFPLFFYLKAFAMANMQNYKQAINDISIAIQLNQEDSQAYLLRARCLQIDGNPNQAFADLQSFIALRPDDKDIHKFAGHLLFENGAFEDAIQAYNQGEIGQSDLQVYLTRSKTFFLLGNFHKSSQDMLQVVKIVNSDKGDQYYFDYQMLKWLAIFFHNYVFNQNEDNYQFSKKQLNEQLLLLKEIYKPKQQQQKKQGKIFKLTQYTMFSAVCYFYLSDYNKAIDYFVQSIDIKMQQINKSSRSSMQYQQQEPQKHIFINQMKYNICLCYCMLHDYPNAARILQQFSITNDIKNYALFQEFIQYIEGNREFKSEKQVLQLFAMRNKMSKFLPLNKIPFLYKKSETTYDIEMKLCIPYPKVEPPNINPKFRQSLIKQIDLNVLERRLQAPWIYKQLNSIKFTDRIDNYSRFSMQNSQINEKKQFKHEMFDSEIHFSSKNLKKKLKLDPKIQQKLNKLLKQK